MRIRDSKPVGGVAPSTRPERTRAAGEVPAGAPRGVAAQVELAGIPEAELTPKVRGALMKLLGEMQQLRKEIDDSRARIAYLERLADEDALTPIANRRAFVRELTRMVAFTNRYGAPSSVVYFDINGMKRINDEHGHPAGDAALLHVAKILLENVRSSDIVGRLGGDEFGAILAQTDEERANAKATSLAAAIADTPFTWGDTEIRVTAAYGVYSFSGDEDPARAIEAADRAMYEQKRSRRSA